MKQIILIAIAIIFTSATTLPAVAEKLKPGDTFNHCDNCPEMVVLPPGSFMMGSPAEEKGRNDDEGPVHKVTIDYQFAVSVYEVTFNEWGYYVQQGECRDKYRPVDKGWGRADMPVIHVSWEDAQAYVQWLSQKTGRPYRLLSEAEWEYAARAGTDTPFHFGNTISTDQANYDGDFTYGSGKKGQYRAQTIPAGSFLPNKFGLHDMHGNVWEWVEDCWHSSYRRAPTDGSAWIKGGDCDKRVLRGGAWSSEPHLLRSAIRCASYADNRISSGYGFRVALTLTP